MYRIQIKTSWRWAPYRNNGDIVFFDDKDAAESLAKTLARDTGYPTRVIDT